MVDSNQLLPGAALPAAQAKSKLVLEQAAAALQAGDPGDAERLLRKHLLEQPKDAAVLAKLAELVLDRQHVEEATVLLRRAAGADPTPQRRMALIQHLQHYVGARSVLGEIETLPPAMRTSFDVKAIEAAALGYLGEHDRQIAIYEGLAKAAPANHRLWKTLGDAYKTVGRLDDAVAAVRKGLEACPTYGEGWWTLSNFKKFKFTDRDLSAMKKALKGKISDEDALHFHFALGKAYEDRNDWRRSFEHYDAGNRIRAKGLAPTAMRVTAYVDRAIAVYKPGLFQHHAGSGCQANDPIFVLGLHRSGSTLIEQILASHPLIEGTSELTIIQQIWDRLGRLAALHGRDAFEELYQLDGKAFREIGEEYVDRSRSFRSTDKPHFVDKLPANWMNLGLIRLALPNAKVIDARRHPMACGFSNFKQNYASGINFSYSQESIGHFYRDYVRFMDHIDAVQPGSVLRVLNERLIDDPEGEVRRMLAFIGVPFDPACLEFYKNKRAVQTPSAEQVRQPINRDGVDYWRHYKQWLGPMKTALGPALDCWDAPQARDKA
jgi:tetratricopeptide (TPR) repeat protein